VVKTQSMGPAVEHLHSIISEDMWGCGRGAAGHGCSFRLGMCANGGIGTVFGCRFGDGHVVESSGKISTMISNLGCCEFLQMLFVFISEMLSKFDEHLVGHQFYMPHVACHCEYSSGLKHELGQVAEHFFS